VHQLVIKGFSFRQSTMPFCCNFIFPYVMRTVHLNSGCILSVDQDNCRLNILSITAFMI